MEEADAGVLVTTGSTAEDEGFDALARGQEPQLVLSKSKMQVCQKYLCIASAFLFHIHDRMPVVPFGWAVLALWVMFSCLMQVELTPPDPADEEAVAYYNAQRGMYSKTNTLKRGMAATRRKPAVAKF